MIRIAAIVTAFAGITLALTGCSLFHHQAESPEQQYLDALNRGNAAAASQIWLRMNADDRAAWTHSEGIEPKGSADDIQSAIGKHLREKEAEENADEDSDAASVIEGDGEQLESAPISAAPGASLKDLPSYAPSDDAPTSP